MLEVTGETLPGLVDDLCTRHETFAALHARNGTPPLWRRNGSFATLVLFILEQQVSLASARAAYLRLHEALGEVRAESFLGLDDQELRQIGFSRQKTGYARGLAGELLSGRLDLESLAAMNDDEATAVLLAIRGIGRWTAACYLLFALGRPDVWPTGDRALQVALRDVLELDGVPEPAAADALASSWAPHRAVAARMLWHEYLGGRAWEPTPTLPGVG